MGIKTDSYMRLASFKNGIALFSLKMSEQNRVHLAPHRSKRSVWSLSIVLGTQIVLEEKAEQNRT